MIITVTFIALFAFVAWGAFALEGVVVVYRDASRTILTGIPGTRVLQVSDNIGDQIYNSDLE